MSGDKGRDGQMYKPNEDRATYVQYSVTASWSSKIKGTIKTLSENFGGKFRLIYATNQRILPDADELVAEQRKLGVEVDIRDRTWCVDRVDTHTQRTVAAEELAKRIVDPLLAKSGLAPHVARPLGPEDARVALIHLALESVDRADDQGITRSSFEALVRSVMHDSSAETTMTEAEIVQETMKLVPAGQREQVLAQVKGALTRLSKKGPVKYVRARDAYHLSFQEQERIRAQTTRVLASEQDLLDELTERLSRIPGIDTSRLDEIADGLRTAMDIWLLHRGEAFAAAVLTGKIGLFDTETLEAQLSSIKSGASSQVLVALVGELLEAPSTAVREYLGNLASAYTLFAFLRQTPDVQKVVVSVFQGGKIWMDTNVVLPLLAETLEEDPSQRFFTSLIHAARESGASLHITDGVVEEIQSHISRSLSCARTLPSLWQGPVPYLFGAFTANGRGRSQMVNWLETFRGDDYPDEDLCVYLLEEHGISRRDLDAEADSADSTLRAAMQEFWIATHEERRKSRGQELDQALVLRLAAHDVTSAVGVLQLRGSTALSPMGYEHWWLTLDRAAFRMEVSLRDQLGADTAPRSPALNPDFLVELLRLRQVRASIERDLHVPLPTMADYTRFAGIPISVVEAADKERAALSGLDERVIQRRVRKKVDEIRWAQGTTVIDRMYGTK